MTSRRWGMLALAAAIIACGCERKESGGEEGAAGEPIVAVRVGKLETRTFADAISAPGQWRSGGDLVISAASASVIETLSVSVGDRVAAGQSVGTMIPKGAWAALKGAELIAREARTDAERADAARALALAKRDLVRVPLVVRQAGVVIRRSAEPGAEVGDGAEVLAIAPWSTIVFEAHVPAADGKRVRPGESATVRDPAGSALAARVTRVLPMASDADQASLVWLAPTPGPGGPTAQLSRFGTAEITVGAPHRALAAPDSAIVEDDLTGERRVAAIDASGRLSWHPVVLGAIADGWHELARTDLTAGTTVAIEGHRGLPDSTRVTPRP